MSARQRGIYLAVALVVWIAPSGCTQVRPHASDPLTDGQELPILSETVGSFSNIAKPLRIVIYDGATLSQFVLGTLDVDFDRHMVLLAAMGPAASPDCSVRIRRVWRDGSRLRVEVEQSYPDPSAARHPASASPFHAVVVPRCEMPIDRFSGLIPGRAVADEVVRTP